MMGNCLKWITCTFTALILLGGAVMLGLGIWVTTQDTEYKHLAGNLYVTAGYIVLSSFVFIIGFLGACGILLLKPALLKVYFALMLLLLLSELALAVYMYVEKDKIQEHIASNWNETSDDVRIIIQKEFKCCGLTPLNLEHQSSSDQSCFEDNDESKERLEDCYKKLLDWIGENHVILASSAVTVAVLQMFILGGTCRLVTEIQTGDRSVRRIRVAPQRNQGHQIPHRSPGQQVLNQSGVATPQEDGGENRKPRHKDSSDFEDGSRTKITRKGWAKRSVRQSSILNLVESQK
ncbi:tetraspanin-9-like isoform X1 [Acropora millepora]|uniref:tetraspanin-9-like isoform X1 n=1 Tax=Acropora millepora TaxID=45264 RepID=UPI001CF1C085|nr:tetraspanin-9-like isoform X1 [Acropora millepora]